MFFEPPKVKSLSRYAEFGSYMGNRHFLVMLAIAFTLHMALIAIYSMVPRQQVIRIPVHAMNIKLAGGSSANGIHMPLNPPKPIDPSVAGDDAPAGGTFSPMRETDPEDAVEKALTPKAKPHPVKPAKVGTKAVQPPDKAHPAIVAPHDSMATPKKYVRTSGNDDDETKAGKGKGKAETGNGNGSAIQGTPGGDEAISRYTQVISQWIINHQSVAKAACGEAKAVTGACNAKGQTVVRLRISRDGRIMRNTVERTSGSELVDQAAIMMVRASDPVPIVPSDYPSENQLEFLIAVQVDLAAQ